MSKYQVDSRMKRRIKNIALIGLGIYIGLKLDCGKPNQHTMEQKNKEGIECLINNEQYQRSYIGNENTRLYK